MTVLTGTGRGLLAVAAGLRHDEASVRVRVIDDLVRRQAASQGQNDDPVHDTKGESNMTVLPRDLSTFLLDRADVLASLEADAHYLQPRLFAIYGIQNSVRAAPFGMPFLGWGLDCRGEGGAVFVDPRDGGTHTSDSAEHLLTVYQRLGEAHLVWLD